MRGSAPSSLEQTLVATGFGYAVEQRRAQGAVVARLLPQVRDIRRFGSAALDLCAVAAGRLDAYYELRLNSGTTRPARSVAAEAGAVRHRAARHAVRRADGDRRAPGPSRSPSSS